MTPPISNIPPTTVPLLSQPTSSAFKPSATKVQTSSTFSKTAIANWKDRSPLTSPDLQAKPATRQIAQSELPGGSTPPPAPIPSTPSTVDTGSGYDTTIPRNYFGPALGTGNGSTSIGVISRFPLTANYSIRPSALFGGNGTIVRVPVTYDFVFGDKEPFERNPLIIFHAGAGVQYSSGVNGGQSSQFGLLGTIGVDVNLFESTALVVSYNTDFGSINGVNFGVGFEF
jgi:hypothetical protein